MEPPSSHSICIINESSRRAPRALLSRAVATTLDLHGRSGEKVNLLLGSDETVRSLNKQFRQVDEETDVLTFPSDDIAEAALGDVAIAIPYASRQAALRKVPVDQELAYLAIHGTLHLLGFEDETDGERSEMMCEMNRVAVAAGLPPDPEWSSILHAEKVV